MWRWGPDKEWELDTHNLGFKKCLYVALEFLRQLAPWPKPLAVPYIALGKEDGEAAFFVMGARDMYTLHRPICTDFGPHLFVRLKGTEEPYLGMFADLPKCRTPIGWIVYEEKGVNWYPQLDASQLRAAVRQADDAGYPGLTPVTK